MSFQNPSVSEGPLKYPTLNFLCGVIHRVTALPELHYFKLVPFCLQGGNPSFQFAAEPQGFDPALQIIAALEKP